MAQYCPSFAPDGTILSLIHIRCPNIVPYSHKAARYYLSFILDSLLPVCCHGNNSQTAAVVQVWRREKVERGLLTVEQKKTETKEVSVHTVSRTYIHPHMLSYDIIMTS